MCSSDLGSCAFLLIGAGALGVKMGWLKAEGRQMLCALVLTALM